jgi:hypothetical protein
MATEEDKKFDAVLGGFLVNDLRVRAGHLHCPESDVLAAYHERSLLPQEMNSWKEHIVGCARCQTILAELEATDSIPFQVAQTAEGQEEALVADAAKPLEAASKVRNAAVATFPEKAGASRLSRALRWQWLAPAGALAAGLLVWVAWHENQQTHLVPASENKVAKLESARAPEPAPPAAHQAPSSAPSDQFAQFSKDQSAVGGIASAEKSAAREELKQLEKLDSRATAAPARRSKVIDKESGARQEAQRDSALAANPVQNQSALDAKAGAVGAMSETVQVQEQPSNAQLPNQQDQLNAQKTGGPSPLTSAESAKKAKSESATYARRVAVPPLAAPAPTAPTPAAALNQATSLQTALASSPYLISAPGRKAFWLAGPAGMIEFSSNGGASWVRQTSNVSVDLAAGSAPSDKVCWIVGRAGTILLTTDAGSHWTAPHSPLDEDLGGVRATDALHATIWNSLNTKTFETADGGLTWKLVPAQ